MSKRTRNTESLTSPTAHLHGVLVDVLGVGVLLLGKSGIGKSECALDLVMRGHRLVADDLIRVERSEEGKLYGSSHELGRHLMEIRGLGIIDIGKLFGIAATRDRKRIQLVIELVESDVEIKDLTGLESESYEILGVKLPLRRIPVRPGRNLTAIVEVAAREYLLEEEGYHTAVQLEERLITKMREGGKE